MPFTLPVAIGSWKRSHQWMCLPKNKVSDRALWLKEIPSEELRGLCWGPAAPSLSCPLQSCRSCRCGNVHSLHRAPAHGMLELSARNKTSFPVKRRWSVRERKRFPLSVCRGVSQTVGVAVAEWVVHRLNQAASRCTWTDSFFPLSPTRCEGDELKHAFSRAYMQ